MRGDGTTSYAIDSARMKAYTLANLGPVRDMSTSSQLATSILGSSNANPQLSNIPGILLVGGAVMLVKDGKRAGCVWLRPERSSMRSAHSLALLRSSSWQIHFRARQSATTLASTSGR